MMKSKSELFQQVRAIDPVSQTDRIADVWLEDGRIKAIAEQPIADYPAETIVRDGRGLIFGPGLVDLYSHSGEPGFEERETVASLMEAAIAGGFTRVSLLPTTNPPVDTPATLSLLSAKVGSLPGVQVSMWGALTQGVEGKQMAPLAELAAAEVVGFTDSQPIANLLLLRRLLEYARPLAKPIAIWPVIPDLVSNGTMREGPLSIRLGLPGVPVDAETAALAAVLEMVTQTETPVHIMRVSTARSVELIAGAKQAGLPVTASTSWMHLLLDTSAIAPQNSWGFLPYHPSLNVAAPLGNAGDRKALVAGVKEGIIDAIAIDHSPHTYEEKTVGFQSAPAGAIGLELALPLLWQKLVETGKLSALQLWQSLSCSPARCLQQTPPSLTVGAPIEAILFDPKASWTVNATSLHSRSANTPWWQLSIQGRAIRQWNYN